MTLELSPIIQNYRDDVESVYHTWFINGPTRLKAFRAIRRGTEQVVADIKGGRFPNDFRGSSLESVLASITEQKQVFEGAAHAFYWKPKLRIPDIYENANNKVAFGQFLETVLNATREDQLVRAIHELDRLKIKGLGPAVANILYFLHPTLLPPSNTAMINGFNLLFGTRLKLGCWTSYLEMRQHLLDLNQQHRQSFSKDLGAFSGLLFEVGAGKLVVQGTPGATLEATAKKLASLQKQRKDSIAEELKNENLHTEMQFHLVRIGNALGYDTLVASNDRSRSHAGQKLSFHCCLSCLPELGVAPEVASTIDLIDVLWFHKGTGKVVCAFEVEKSTSIYSGILRLADLAIALPDDQIRVCLVAPDAREKEVTAQLRRPSLLATTRKPVSYMLFSDLNKHCDAICHFGNDHSILDKLVKTIAPLA